VGWNELQDLIRQSYEMVAAKTTKKKSEKKKKLAKPGARKKAKRVPLHG
jgi:predicted DNA-binding protein (MmcQ/YjbR family)